jgi:uncharacterized phage infection (PIP) family protein YhgE
MPTELTAYAEDQTKRLTEAKKDAQDSLAAAQSGYAEAREALTDASGKVTTLEADIARIRTRLATIVTPADGEPLLDELAQKTIELHTSQAAALEAEEDLRVNESALRRANTELARLTTALTAAEAAEAEATEQEKRRDALFAKIDEEPLLGLSDAAQAALENPPYKEAETRVQAELPEALRELARKRRENRAKLHTLHRTVADLSQSKLSDELNLYGGTSGKAEKARAAYERAQEDLRDFVVRGKERYDHAQSILASVADPDKDPLTDAQADEIQATDDEELRDDRADAAAKALDVEEKKGAVIDAEIKVEQAILAARAADVDADVEENEDVKTAREELKTAKDLLEPAETAYTDEMRELVEEWGAAVPDSAWRRYDNFLKAEEMLKALDIADANVLRTAYQSAEGAFGDALAESAKRARTTTQLEAERARSAAFVDFHSAASDRLLFSALRGDK